MTGKFLTYNQLVSELNSISSEQADNVSWFKRRIQLKTRLN